MEDMALVVFQKVCDGDQPEFSDGATWRTPVAVRRGPSALQRAVFGILDEGVQFVDLSRAWPLDSSRLSVQRCRPHVAALLDLVVLAHATEEERREPLAKRRRSAVAQVPEADALTDELLSTHTPGPVPTPEGHRFLVVQWVADNAFSSMVDEMTADRADDADAEDDDEEDDDDDEDD